MEPDRAAKENGSGGVEEKHYSPEEEVKTLEMGTVLGEGTYGRVYQHQDEAEQQWAVKCIDHITPTDPIPCLIEAVIMKSLAHRALMGARAVDCDERGLVIVQERSQMDAYQWAKGAPVADYPYPPTPQRPLAVAVLRLWCFDLLQALSTLHQMNVLHGDPKAANVLLFPRGRVRLADFTIARLLPTEWAGCLYTVTHRAPEIWRKESPTLAADVWAMGCLFVELATGSGLFPAHGASSEPDEKHAAEYMSDQQAWAQRIDNSEGKVRYRWPTSLDEAEYASFRDLLGHMLRLVPGERMTVARLLRHPWFVGLRPDSAALLRPEVTKDSAALAWLRERIRRGVIPALPPGVTAEMVRDAAHQVDYRLL